MVNVTDTVTALIGLESSSVVIRELIGKHLMRITTCLLASVLLTLMDSSHQ